VSIVALAALAVLGADASVLIVPASSAARTTCETLVESFAAEHVKVKLAGERAEATGCLNKGPDRTLCLVDALEHSKVDGLVLVSVATQRGQLSITMQLLSRTGESERQEKISGPKSKVATWAKPAIARTLAALRAVLVDEAPSPAVAAPTVEKAAPIDAPTARPTLTPKRAVIQPQVELAEAPPAVVKPKVGAWVVTVIAIAAAGTAATLGVLGASDKARLGQLDNGVSALSYSEARALRTQANTELTIALGAGLGAATAGVIAGVLWIP
jgi:hypothetical protein